MTDFICSVCGITAEHQEPAYIDLEFIFDLGNVSIHSGQMCGSCAERAYGFASMLAVVTAPNDKFKLAEENRRLKSVNKRLTASMNRRRAEINESTKNE